MEKSYRLHDMHPDTRAADNLNVQRNASKVNLDALSASLAVGQVRMRRKQGIFYPKKSVLMIAHAFRCEPPPALVVQFDNNCVKTTFPIKAGA